MQNLEKKYFRVSEYSTDTEIWIVEDTLRNILTNVAEETTTPYGVAPKLYVKYNEKDNTWELRKWIVNSIDRLVNSFESEEDARNEWFDCVYEDDFMNSEECYQWCENRNDAIKEYAERHEMTFDDVKKIINETIDNCNQQAKELQRKEYLNYQTYLNQYNEFKTMPKKMLMLCLKIMSDCSRSNITHAPIYVQHDKDFIENVSAFYKQHFR